MKQSYISLVLFIFIGFLFFQPSQLTAQCVPVAEDTPAHPKRDIRGVFLPSLFSISWPSDRNAAPAVQQAELITMLDEMEANGYNAVFLQVRPECDALYVSAIEPWSYWLTGTQGTAPSPVWDPLQFAIDESHARGLELHAWLNPYRAQRTSSYTKAANHVTNLHPSWVFTASNNADVKILDPGLPAVEAYIVSVVEDIADRYDVDGIHFDDYFYPSGGMATNQDAATYAANNPGGLSLGDWRRDNVNRMITEVYDAIQVINTNDNKSITFGVSPFGIWKSGTPPGISGTSSYSALYCDPIAWMQAGKVDYLAPQLYWAFGGSQDYDILSQWWNDQADLYNVHMYISQAYYKMLSPWLWASSELENQIDENREASMNVTYGQIAYRYNEIGDNLNGLNTALNADQFLYKSYAPPIIGAGKDVTCALIPDNIRFGPLKVEWDTPVAASDGDLPQKYVVYAFDSAAQATSNKNDGTKIIDIVAGNEATLTQSQIDTKFIVVSSLDKNNNEAGDFCNFPLNEISTPCSVASITAPTAQFNCSGSYTATTSTVFPIESSTVVVWNYDFGGGNTFSQEQTVTIEDAIAPTVVTQNISITLTGASASITTNDIDNGSSDNCAIESMSLDVDTFTCADIGMNIVMLTVVDKNGNSASAPATVTVQGELTEYITGPGWTNGVPHAGSLARISGNYNTAIGNIDTCACEVTATGILTVEANHFLKVDGNIVVDGSLIVEHQGNLVQVNPTATVTKNGTINVNVTTPVLSNRDFMVMGSPMDSELRTGVFNSAFLVLNSTPANFMPHAGVPMGGTNFADDKLINGKFWDAYTGAINIGEGFIVRPQTSYTDPAVISYDMTYELGTLNNGDVTRPIVFNGLVDNPTGTPNILANPYASAISAVDLINDNPLVSEVYFWEHLTPPSTSLPGSNNMNFSMDDISIFNGSMGIPAVNDPGMSTASNGVISTGQGFAIKAQAAGTITFTNNMRLTSGNSTLRNPQEVPVDKLLIEVRNTSYGVGSFTGVAFNPNATEALDEGFDTNRLATIVSLYSHLQNGSEQLAIQTMPEFDATMKIPMGFTTQVEADLEYVISLANVEGNQISEATVYLIDNELGTVTNLSESDYIFRSGKYTYNNRFTLQFESESILGINNYTANRIILAPNPTNGLLNIHSSQNPITGINVYDMQGRKVNQVVVNSELNYTIDLSRLDQGMYFVAVTSESGTVTKRVIKK